MDRKNLLYTSGSILKNNGNLTGGTKRFRLLVRYFSEKGLADICSMDLEHEMQEQGFAGKWFLEKPKGIKILKFLPPEARIAIENRTILRKIVKNNYQNIVVFDVPPAVCLCLFGAKNLVLMLRKDIVEYEKTHNKKISIWKQIYFRISEAICILRAKKIIVQCKYDKDNLISRHRILKKRIEEITRIQINNVNPPWVRMDCSNKESGETFKVCFIGGFDNPRKGQDVFLEAAESVADRCSNICFEVIGGGEKLSFYKEKYKNDAIHFYGRKENPSEILLDCDLLVVPSLADSCPNTVIEGIYGGVPVIGSNRGGIPDLLDDEEALFEPTADALKEIITKCMRDKEFLFSLKEKQKKRKKELEFLWEEKIAEIIF